MVYGLGCRRMDGVQNGHFESDFCPLYNLHVRSSPLKQPGRYSLISFSFATLFLPENWYSFPVLPVKVTTGKRSPFSTVAAVCIITIQGKSLG